MCAGIYLVSDPHCFVRKLSGSPKQSRTAHIDSNSPPQQPPVLLRPHSPNMAKARESSKLSHAHPEKEEKKKKTKRSDENGVHKSKDKKDKKEKKADREALAERALNEIKSAPAAQIKSDDEGEIAETDAAAKEALRPVGALVPFANPLADEKVAKKVFKSVKKGSWRICQVYIYRKEFVG
jgi:hypothetical protein